MTDRDREIAAALAEAASADLFAGVAEDGEDAA
mgnify:CR=1 FL=1